MASGPSLTLGGNNMMHDIFQLFELTSCILNMSKVLKFPNKMMQEGKSPHLSNTRVGMSNLHNNGE